MGIVQICDFRLCAVDGGVQLNKLAKLLKVKKLVVGEGCRGEGGGKKRLLLMVGLSHVNMHDEDEMPGKQRAGETNTEVGYM